MKKIIPHDAILIPDNAECVFRGVIFDTYQWQQEMFDGSMATFEALRRPDTVQAICIEDGKMLVVEQEQAHRGKYVDFPGGRVNPTDSSTLKAAQRELKEETGMTFMHWKLVRVEQPQPKIEWFVYTYVADSPVGRGAQSLDAGEKINAVWRSLEEVQSLLAGDVKYINKGRSLFDAIKVADDLIALPEFQGKEVNR